MIVSKNTPSLDLHGEVRQIVKVLVDEFIKDNYKIGNKTVLIIHGKSTNILTKEVHDVLSHNKLVKNYKLDNWNLGQTIVEIV